MKFITGLLFVLNVILWLAAIVVCFIYGVPIGISAIFGLIGFFVAYKISGGTISLKECFELSDLDLFKKKISWANAIGIAVVAVCYFISMFFVQ